MRRTIIRRPRADLYRGELGPWIAARWWWECHDYGLSRGTEERPWYSHRFHRSPAPPPTPPQGAMGFAIARNPGIARYLEQVWELPPRATSRTKRVRSR